MKVVFCWAKLSWYMAACWDELCRRGVEVHVIAPAPGREAPRGWGREAYRFTYTLLTEHEVKSPDVVRKNVEDQAPDVIVISGWWNPAYRALTRPGWAGGDPTLLLAMDNPDRGDLRQILASRLYAGYFRRFAGVIVPGERGRCLARRWGFADSQIAPCLYGVDGRALSPLLDRRTAGGWPKRFVFVGQYVERKGVDILVEASEAYVCHSEDPWQVWACGAGPLEGALEHSDAVKNVGFVEPWELPGRLEECGAFILPSRYDAWPLAIVEACAAGLPVVATSACGSAVELLRHMHNGIEIPAGSAEHLEAAMHWIDRRWNEAPEMGRYSRYLAEPYLAREWARKWEAYLKQMGP